MTRLEAEKQLWSLQKTLESLKLGVIDKPAQSVEQLEKFIDALIIASDSLNALNNIESTEKKGESTVREYLIKGRDFANSIGFDVPKKLIRLELSFGVDEAPRMKCEAYPDFNKKDENK